GWCDSSNLLRWELMGQSLPDEMTKPNVWVVNVNPDRKTEDPPNWTLTPLRASRAVASVGQRVRFRTSLQFTGQKTKEIRPPYRLGLEIDGQPQEGNIDFPKLDRQDASQLPLDNISYAFQTPGSHLVSVIVEPDGPKNEQAPGYIVKDELPGDNRQD